MSTNFQGLSEKGAIASLDSLSLQQTEIVFALTSTQPTILTLTLGELPVGARLVVRCKADWRAASVASRNDECIRLNVNSQRGGTYRLRRPPDTLLQLDGCIPVLKEAECEEEWRGGFLAYDARW